ncbi:MAG: glycosyltransferase [Nitrospirae bacterium]|nr:glycosyltransferase [Nitrospirota bacterium]
MSIKIAVTSAFGWPYVRRGNRVAYELAVYLASQGNEVHFVTTKPGILRREKIIGNLIIKYYPVIDHPFLTRFNLEYWQTFALTCISALVKENYDLVYTCLTMDACAAGLNKTIRGTPFIPILITGDPLYRDARWAKRFFRRAIEKASRLVTISHFVNEILKRDFSLEGVMIPCPVDTSKFYYTGKKETGFPRILCTATLLMERKRVPLLVKAFERLIDNVPDAVLQLAGETTPEVTRNLLMSVNSKTRKSIEIVDITSDAVLSSFYRSATITVLPSLNEAFGMVTTESLASGTPVVGTRSGGTAEILDDPRVGVLFEPGDGPEELCKALIKGIELSGNPDTPRRCNEHAQRYSWNNLGPKYEELQEGVLGEIRKVSGTPKKIGSKITITSFKPNQSSFTKGKADKSVLSKLFVDNLDSLEITSSIYYNIDSREPRYLHLLDWIFSKVRHPDSVLVMSLDPSFLILLLKECGIEAKQVITPTWLDGTNKTVSFGIDPATQDEEQITGSFDIIICDDLLQYWPAPLRGLEELKKRLKPEGVLLLSTHNAASGVSRLRLLTGQNVYPWFNDSTLKGSAYRNENGSNLYREYTLGEVNDLVSRAGFKIIEKQWIIGNKNIDKSVNFASIAVKTYMAHKICHKIQRVVPRLRSHLFVAAVNSLDTQ